MSLFGRFVTVVASILFLSAVPGSSLAAQSLEDWIGANCENCIDRMSTQTGAYILEKGEESLIGRAWLTQHASRSIDVQYFIWSTDNIGTLAAEGLLRAAERGVRVRVLVDDFLIDAEDRTLLLLSAHPNAEIRIYNPNFAVGVSFWQRIKNAFSDFRGLNQRMHDKTAIFDGVAGITGGRNMADEYFDFDHEYNFRDRDILLLGAAVDDMQTNFEEFWSSAYAVPVEAILADERAQVSDDDIARYTKELHAYAADPANFAPAVREAIASVDLSFPALLQAMTWDAVTFISDVPGKNKGESGLSGGGESTSELAKIVRSAKESILIQSPYLVMPEGAITLFGDLVNTGVRVRISTNSLASTDNIQAFSGYAGQRRELLEAGIEIYEFKPYPALRSELIDRLPSMKNSGPVFALHAKSLVVDDRLIYVGTFNLDPRSANLNTEVGAVIENPELAGQLTMSIERDIHPDNSWQTTRDFNPDDEVGIGKRMRVWFNRVLAPEPLL